ncbi:DUF4296 domain-containing protein [Mucilaginibacter robiniae]|uniref:DUF4296 domain-containing protein n=1 Tax=Mucilaginibacter robiniae TaxID=2728022 RepID=A0A7L5EBH6_9SPHI|nr:DUF4296 domain-containing protein [Mucilaginibacter robiniae]QJD97756.1 DUF4296 domain-containing protein [Mucilaginibacter robiniae]
MRIYKILFFLVLVFFSCSSKTPPGILTPEQMTDVLIEVHLIDGQMLVKPQAPDTLYKYGMGQYIMAFKQHHTDSAQFRRSFIYYSRKPDQLSDIYEKVIKNIQSKNDSLTKSISKQQNALPRK